MGGFLVALILILTFFSLLFAGSFIASFFLNLVNILFKAAIICLLMMGFFSVLCVFFGIIVLLISAFFRSDEEKYYNTVNQSKTRTIGKISKKKIQENRKRREIGKEKKQKRKDTIGYSIISIFFGIAVCAMCFYIFIC